MACSHCNSNRILEWCGKSNDVLVAHLPSICGEDDIQLSFCLDCGIIQNFKQISDEILLREMSDKSIAHHAEDDDYHDWYDNTQHTIKSY